MPPPYENEDTLARLAIAVNDLDPLTVVCLGDSFDDLASLDALNDADHANLSSMMAGRRWIWIEGNHDPGPVQLGGSHLAELPLAPLTFRHIAKKSASGEISGHYHPKAGISIRGRSVTRPCFLYDSDRVILPAFGTYTGGLRASDPDLSRIMRPETVAVLTDKTLTVIPMPGGRQH